LLHNVAIRAFSHFKYFSHTPTAALIASVAGVNDACNRCYALTTRRLRAKDFYFIGTTSDLKGSFHDERSHSRAIQSISLFAQISFLNTRVGIWVRPRDQRRFFFFEWRDCAELAYSLPRTIFFFDGMSVALLKKIKNYLPVTTNLEHIISVGKKFSARLR